MDDMSTGGHEANRDSVPLRSCTDMGVSKDFRFSKKMKCERTRVTAENFGEWACDRTFFGNSNSPTNPKFFASDCGLTECGEEESQHRQGKGTKNPE